MFLSVYVSTAAHPLTEEELLALLETSRRNNARDDITGLLLYKDGSFMQFLEGPRDAVCELLETIRHDVRHRNMIVLFQQEHPVREFPEWSMAFQCLDGVALPEIPGYGDFLDLPLTSEQFLMNPSKSLRLLLSCRELLH
jgi:hypothetical protein